MNLGPHADFIIAAYGVAALVIAGLTIAWVEFDNRALRRQSKELAERARRDKAARAHPHGARRRTVPPCVAAPADRGPPLDRLSGAGRVVPVPARRRRSIAAAVGVLIGHLVPNTPLPPVEGLVRDGVPVPGIAANDFNGAVSLVNVWASWW